MRRFFEVSYDLLRKSRFLKVIICFYNVNPIRYYRLLRRYTHARSCVCVILILRKYNASWPTEPTRLSEKTLRETSGKLWRYSSGGSPCKGWNDRIVDSAQNSCPMTNISGAIRKQTDTANSGMTNSGRNAVWRTCTGNTCVKPQNGRRNLFSFNSPNTHSIFPTEILTKPRQVIRRR